MSDYLVEYCPWCGSSHVEDTTERDGHIIYQAKCCVECDRTFIVKEPTSRESVEWTTAE